MQLDYRGAAGRPYVHLLIEGDSQVIGVTPVDEIKVKVVSQLGSIQDFIGYLSYFPRLFLWENLTLFLSDSLKWTCAVKVAGPIVIYSRVFFVGQID